MKMRSILLVALMAIAAAAFQSCKSDNSADASDLLKTVPSDASLVAVANVESLLEKAGCEVDGSEIKPGKEISGLIPQITDQRLKKLATAFYNGESGIDPTVALIFTEGYYTYVTGIVSEPAKFKKIVEENYGTQFTEQNGVEMASAVAMADNHFWINVNQSSVDPAMIKHFLSLAKDQSFLSNSYSEKLEKIDKDVKGWGSVSGMLNTANLGFQQRATVQVAMQMLFEDVQNFTFDLEFSKGEMTSEIALLNSKGKTAKFLFPSEKIDLATVEKLGGNADMVFAMAVPAKLVKQIQEDASKKGPSMLGVYSQMLSCIDGTVAIAGSQNSAKGVITTTGENTSDLVSVLTGMGMTVNKEGKLLMFSQGTLINGKPVSEMAAELKGATAGAVFSGDMMKENGKDYGISGAALKLEPKDGGMTLEIKAISKDKDENILITILKNIK